MIETRDKNGKVYVRPEKKKTETAATKPRETAVKGEPKAKHVGGGWYETPDGSKVRKSELESG